jgi:hypothetical protein
MCSPDPDRPIKRSECPGNPEHGDRIGARCGIHKSRTAGTEPPRRDPDEMPPDRVH